MSLNTVYQGKITSIQPTYKDKGYFGVAEKSLKNSSTTKPNPLLLKITQMTEFSKQYWEIKWNNFIPKLTWSIVRECYDVTCNSSKRKCYLSLNEKVEINSYKGNNLLNQR